MMLKFILYDFTYEFIFNLFFLFHLKPIDKKSKIIIKNNTPPTQITLMLISSLTIATAQLTLHNFT